jgi:hypothetical protein
MHTRRRTIRSSDEIRQILAEQRASGQSVRAFALERGIPVSTLALWSRRHPPRESPALVPLRVREPASAESTSDSGLRLRIELPGGAVIAIDGVPRPGELRSLLAELDLA